ncbi:MAG: hypothetical protein Q9157_006296 [Trypethelium eluteriae]
MSLADKVMLHEVNRIEIPTLPTNIDCCQLTHTRAGGQKIDVGGFRNAYGWKSCKKLAVTTGGDASDRNAGKQVCIREMMPGRKGANDGAVDCYALFGSAVDLLLRGFSIDDEGKVTEPNTGNPSSGKRSVDLRPWLWSS